MLYEWHYLLKKQNYFFKFLACCLTYCFLRSMLFIAWFDQNGYLLLIIFCCIASVDIMAMVGGKLLQGPKLAPKISPNKTISGLACGCISAAFVANLLSFLPNYHLPAQLPTEPLLISFYAILLGLTAQASDLLVSIFKRQAKVKDTGNIIPGHGGVLDRFDSFILTSILIAIYLLLQNN